MPHGYPDWFNFATREYLDKNVSASNTGAFTAGGFVDLVNLSGQIELQYLAFSWQGLDDGYSPSLYTEINGTDFYYFSPYKVFVDPTTDMARGFYGLRWSDKGGARGGIVLLQHVLTQTSLLIQAYQPAASTAGTFAVAYEYSKYK